MSPFGRDYIQNQVACANLSTQEYSAEAHGYLRSITFVEVSVWFAQEGYRLYTPVTTGRCARRHCELLRLPQL
jgi:hypothetical protein